MSAAHRERCLWVTDVSECVESGPADRLCPAAPPAEMLHSAA